MEKQKKIIKKEDNKFGTALFGYNKKRVNEYIFQNITTLSQENESLKTKNSEILSELNTLKAMQDEINKGKASIASAILKAEEKAKEIVSTATIEAEVNVLNIMNKIEDAKKKFDFQKAEIASFKDDLLNMLSKTAEDMDNISKL